MMHDAHQKVKASHLKRNAYLYVRQSTLRQVFENTESTQRHTRSDSTPLRLDGHWTKSSSSIRIWDSQAPRRPIGKDFNGW